jgi:hypothetical protein
MSSGRTWLALALVAVLSGGCADQGVKQMTTKPKAGASEAGAAPERRVALFRVIIEVDGEPMDEPWTLHWSGLRLFTIVAPKDAQLASRHSFLPGRPSAAAGDEGWGFVAVPPGAYQLVFEGMAIRFAMTGARFIGSEAVPIGRSPPSTFAVPSDANLIYIGTFTFACHQPNGPDAVKLECASLEIRNEAQRARQIAQTSLDKYGPLQEALASGPKVKLSR